MPGAGWNAGEAAGESEVESELQEVVVGEQWEEQGMPAQLPPVLDLAQSRAMLKALGERPPHHMVEEAQESLAAIDAALAQKLDELVLQAVPAGADRSSWNVEQAMLESEAREEAEREKLPYKSIIQLDELHSTYEAMVKSAEEAVVARYEAHEYADRGARKIVEKVEDGDALMRDLQQAFAEKKAELDLSKRGLEALPESFGRIYTLVVLDLSGNELEMLPDSISGLTNLSTLKVQNNQLRTLPDSIGLLKVLKVLDVSSNKLATLPESITRCSALVELYANFNQMMFLPAKFGYDLENLEKLSLHYNNLSVLPNSLCELKALKFLDLHFNKLRALPQAIGNLGHLEVLNVSSNFSDLTEIPDSVGDLANLVDLDLSFNQLRELPASLGKLDKLRKLKLDENPLIDPPMDVVKEGDVAVMEYLVMRWNSTVMEAQESSATVTSRTPDISGVGSRSWGVGDWVGSVAGSIQDYILGSQKSFGRHSRRSEDYFEQL